MGSTLLNVKTNYSVTAGTYNTAPFAYTTLTGTLSAATTNTKVMAAAGMTTAEKDAIQPDDTFLIANNNQLMVVSVYDKSTNNIIFKNTYTGGTFSGGAARWTPGPRQKKYPREFSIKGTSFEVDGVAYTAGMKYPFNESKERIILVRAVTGNLLVSDGQQADEAGGGGGAAANVNVISTTAVAVTPIMLLANDGDAATGTIPDCWGYSIENYGGAAATFLGKSIPSGFIGGFSNYPNRLSGMAYNSLTSKLRIIYYP